jgi:hypothetical protein
MVFVIPIHLLINKDVMLCLKKSTRYLSCKIVIICIIKFLNLYLIFCVRVKYKR